MDRKLSDRVPIIIVLIIGIILVVDLVNVFVIGGPSFFSLIFKPGGTASGTSPAGMITGNSSGGKVLTETSSGSAIFVPTTATPVPVIRYVSVVTPIPASGSDQSSQRYIPPTTQPTQDPDEYALIYSEDLSYVLGSNMTAVAFDVKEPPLVINYDVSPVMVSDVIAYTNNTGKSKGREESVNISRPSEFTRFTITVYDRKSGGKITQDGYGGLYGIVPQKTFIVREAGSYIIQFDGDDSEAHVDMLIKREGNIV